MKSLKLLLVSISVGSLFTACSVLPEVLGAVFEARPEQGWAKKNVLNTLLNHSGKQLLPKNERNKAAKNICELKHLDRKKDNPIYTIDAKVFCKLEENDKIYFYDKCMECGDSIDTIATSYLLVRDGEPIEMAEIERKYSKELGRSVPIVERLH